jgi:hypothetical protein
MPNICVRSCSSVSFGINSCWELSLKLGRRYMKYKGAENTFLAWYKWRLCRQKSFFIVWLVEINHERNIERDWAVRKLQRMGRQCHAHRVVKELRHARRNRAHAVRRVVSSLVHEACTRAFRVRFKRSVLQAQCWARQCQALHARNILWIERRKSRAALLLQCLWRGRKSAQTSKARKIVAIGSIVVIQKTWRGFHQRCTLKGLVVIQHAWSVIQRTIPTHAATCVQTLLRKRQALRRHGDAVQHALHQHRSLRSQMKVVLHCQTRWRRHASMQRVQRLKCTIDEAEAGRTHVIESMVHVRSNHAIRIQSCVRVNMAMKIMESKQLRKAMHCYVERYALKTLRTALRLHVQKRSLAYVKQREICVLVTRTQSAWRRLQAMQYVRDIRALKIVSKDCGRQWVAHGLDAAIQRLERDRARNLAATKMQTLFWTLKGHTARIHFNRMKHRYAEDIESRKRAVVALQTRVRACKAKMMMARTRVSTRAVAEGRVLRLQVDTNHRTCTHIQSRWRRRKGIQAARQRQEIAAMMHEEALALALAQFEREKSAGLLLQNAARRFWFWLLGLGLGLGLGLRLGLGLGRSWCWS